MPSPGFISSWQTAQLYGSNMLVGQSVLSLCKIIHMSFRSLNLMPLIFQLIQLFLKLRELMGLSKINKALNLQLSLIGSTYTNPQIITIL
jgi:hypothetical protein